MKRLLLGLALVVIAAAAHAKSAAVVASGQRPFQEAAKAALDELGGSGQLLDAAEVKSGSAGVHGSAVVVSIGPLAGGSVAKNLPADAQVIAVLTPRLMGLPEGRTLQVPLDPSADDVLDVISRVLPKHKRVGVLVGKSGPGADHLEQICKRFGLAVKASSPGETLGASLDRLLPVVDVLWVDRSHAANQDPESMQLVLARSAEAGRPVVGTSKSHVLSGALLAVVPEPARHGKVAGELARRILAGESVRIVPTPLGTVLWNEAKARHHGARVPADLAARLEKVQ